MTNEQKFALQNRIASVLVRYIEPMFTPDVCVTLIARKPGNDEADVLVTSESDLQQLTALIDRSIQREPVASPQGVQHG